MNQGENYVLGLDVGTTSVRGFVFNSKGDVLGTSYEHVELLYPKPTWVEIDPDSLWIKVQKVMSESISKSNLTPGDIKCMGISCQRATFTTWSATTGRHFHNFITWKDLRADKIVSDWNESISMKALRVGGKILHGISRQPRYKAAGILKLYNKLVTLRLLWVLDNIPGLRDAANHGDVRFGCVDAWLLYKLTGNHMSEVSNIAATGIFDPFTMSYATWAFNLFNIPISIMPPVVASCGDHFGRILPEVLGAPIPVRAVLADQSASVFGSCCFTPGSAKITLGTGSFLDVVTSQPHASMNGLVPLVAWKIEEEKGFLAEGSVHDIGVMVDWAKSIGFFQDINQISDIASEMTSTEGLYFIPGFHGLQAPVSDPTAAAGFIGLSLNTTKEQMLRAILESIAFSQKHLVDTFLSETNYKIERLVVDGGVANNNFILQMIADLTGLPVIRPDFVEMSVWGIASLAGLSAGVWKSFDDLKRLKKKSTIFNKKADNKRILTEYNNWTKACSRFTHWNK